MIKSGTSGEYYIHTAIMSLREYVFVYELSVHVFGRSPFVFSIPCLIPRAASARSAYKTLSHEASKREMKAPLGLAAS